MKLRPNPIKLEVEDRSVQVNGFVLSETIRPPGRVVPAHYHEHTNLGFVLSGPHIETIGTKPFDLEAGSIVIRPAGEMHKNQYGIEPARCFIIEIGTNRMETLREYSDIFDRSDHIKDVQMLNLGFRLYQEFGRTDTASSLAREGLIWEIMAQAVRRHERGFSGKKPPWFEQALDYIHAGFSQPIHLSAVAKMSGVHPAHLAKVFRSHLHCTMGEYVRQLRLEYAERELIDSDKPLSEIAVTAGFYDQSHFNNAFKSHFGITPLEFRLLKKKVKFFS